MSSSITKHIFESFEFVDISIDTILREGKQVFHDLFVLFMTKSKPCHVDFISHPSSCIVNQLLVTCGFTFIVACSAVLYYQDKE